MAALELSDLSKSFGTVVAVAGLSLQIRSGEFVALLGPSGCGKTTTLQMIAGFVAPSSGDIRVDGRTINGIPPHRRNIGVVFQSYALFPHLTVADNVAFGLRMRRVAGSDIRQRVRHALDIVRLGALEQRHPHELSGGQQQRVALARALVIEPSLLLLDEPLSNLDAQLREQMRFEIRQIQRSIAITTVFVTHDQGEAMAAADRLVVMAGGRVRQVGSAREIYEQPADTFVAGFIGQANMLRGRVRAVSGAEACVDAAGWGSLVARHRGDLRPGDAAVLVLRPEDLRLAATAPPDGNAILGSIARVSYLGASIVIGVQAGGATLSVLAERSLAVPEDGAQAFVCWPAHVGVLLPDAAA
jgi:putative spermidine/putrescine transport system ATP-binding protein